MLTNNTHRKLKTISTGLLFTPIEKQNQLNTLSFIEEITFFYCGGESECLLVSSGSMMPRFLCVLKKGNKGLNTMKSLNY